MKKVIATSFALLSLFGTVLAEDDEVPINNKEETKEVVDTESDKGTEKETEKPTCKSSFRVYNNTSQTVTIYNQQDIDVIVSGSYSYTIGECGTPVKYSVEGEYKLADGSMASCSYKAAGTRNYPDENGAVESIGLTALCGNEEKTAEIKSFTNTQYKYSGWSNASTPTEYVYGLKLKATNPNGPMKDVEFTLSDKNGTVMKDMSGREIVLTTDENGEATVFLYAGYDYVIRETKIDDKWSIQNGDIIVNNTNATVVKASDFALNKFEEYYSITFENQMSEAEEKLQENLKAKQEELTAWKEKTLKQVEDIYNSIDMSDFNENSIKESVALKQEAVEKLNTYVEEQESSLEESLRAGKEITFVYDLGGFEKSLNSLSGHWFHWIIMACFLLGFGLHFIFNKHLIIDLLLLPAGYLYFNDICMLSKVFFVGLIISCVLFTILEIILGKKNKEVSENE